MGAKRPGSLRDLFTGKALAGVGAMGALFAGGHAFAEPQAPRADDIVVTGERNANPYADPEAPYRVERSANGLLTEPLVNTPKTITVLPAEVLHDLGATSFRDIFRTQPGITLGTGEGGNAFGDRIFIRGFDARNDVYIDGMRDPGVGQRETFAVQQVEIVKGPSSLLAGRGTTGGAVSLVSKQASQTNATDLDLTVGTDNLYRATVDWNRKVTDDFAVRVNLMGHTQDTPGRDEVFSDRWGAAAALLYQPTDALALRFDYYHLTMDYMPDWGLPYDIRINAPFEVDRDNFYGVLKRDFGDVDADIYSGSLDYQFSDNLRAHTILRVGETGSAYVVSAPEGPNATLRTVNANAKFRDATTKSWYNQTNLTWDFNTGRIGHTLVAGFEIGHEETKNNTFNFVECGAGACVGVSNTVVQNLDNPNPNIAFSGAAYPTGYTIIETETKAGYFIDTMKLGPHWQVVLGARYDDYESGVRGTGTTVRRSSQSTYWNYQASIVYKPTEASTLYASYATSSNPSCEQLDSVALDYTGCDVRVVALDPIDNRSFELGYKMLVNDHLNASVALFQIDRDGVPIVFAGAVGLQDQRFQGVEFGVAGNLTNKWSLFGGLTLITHEITDSPNTAEIGRGFPNVSDSSFSLTLRHQITDRLHLGGTATYASEKSGGTTSAGTTLVPDYWRFDAFGGFKIREGMELSFNVLNIGDERYFDALYRSAPPFVYVAPGRSASITLDIEF
jgi:catecholate siderophore receptor